jgi:hypothetical protein
MEDLALIVSLMLLGVYGSSLAAFGLSWVRNRTAFVFTVIFGLIAIATGASLWVSLLDGNGPIIGSIPIAIGLVSIFNSLRRRKA